MSKNSLKSVKSVKSVKSIETEKVPLMEKEYESDSSIEISKKEKPVKPKYVWRKN